MAKKPKKVAAEGDAPEEGQPAAAGSGSKKKIIIIAGAVVLLLGIGGGGFMFMKSKGKHDEPVAEMKKPVAFMEVREMVVNLAGEQSPGAPRFLKLRVALELKDAKLLEEIKPLVPRIEDTFQVYMRDLRASDLDGSAGIYRLREELLRRVNVAIYPAKADAVLFKDLVVQ